MLWTMAIILMGLWALGVVSGAALGGWVYLLLAFALLAFFFAVVQSAAASRTSS